MGRVRLEELGFQDLTAGGREEEGQEAQSAPVQCGKPKLDRHPCASSFTQKEDIYGLNKGFRCLHFHMQKRGGERADGWQNGEACLCFLSFSFPISIFFSLSPARSPLSCLVSEKTILLGLMWTNLANSV